jgi:hypothetical protein
MGRKERREREQKRENYAAQRSTEKRKNSLIAIGVFAIIAVIVGYSVYVFLTMDQSSVPGGPENAGALGSEHSHTGILVKVFGDTFEFSGIAYKIKSPWIHFEGGDGSTIHTHAAGVTVGYLMSTLPITLDDECFQFGDRSPFCTNEEYSLKFFINGEQVNSIRDHDPSEDDKILVLYGAETPEEIEALLLESEAQMLVK